MSNDIFEPNNEEEAEIAQIRALQINNEAIAAIRAKMPKGPSLEECEECGADIPKERQIAVPGVTLCIDCARRQEHFKKFHAS